ncbi:MAG: hypothetical protein GEV08_07585 [Acidimicrobiia bacterium]|nr:hypothetical protein [Acidimicrobiia bacterium]
MTVIAEQVSTVQVIGRQEPVARRGGIAAATLRAAAAGSVVALVAAGAARALDVPMRVAVGAGEPAELIPAWGYLSLVLPATVLGGVLAAAARRFTARPARAFCVVATVMTLVSLAMPLTTQHATVATQVALEVIHVLVALAVVPILARRLPTRS